MLWIFVLALIMPISLGSCEETNLAQIKWAHAVNSQAELQKALDDSTIQFIEADVILGKHEVNTTAPSPDQPEGNKPVENKPEENKSKSAGKSAVAQGEGQKVEGNAPAAPAAGTAEAVNQTPIMGHPPTDKSDLSLEQFLNGITAHNKDAAKPKGVKFDFKSIEALKESLKSWKSTDLKGDLWINADILAGPGKIAGDEVNATEFFEAIHSSKDLKNKTLSIGWTTELGKHKVSYNVDHVEEMIKVINDSKIGEGYPITFPVRAAIAAESKDNLQKLYDTVSKEHKVTFTIWSGASDTDKVDHAKLQDFINAFGVNKVYVDVPNDLETKLNLNGASTNLTFGLLNVAAIVIAMFFRNGLH